MDEALSSASRSNGPGKDAVARPINEGLSVDVISASGGFSIYRRSGRCIVDFDEAGALQQPSEIR